MNFSKINYRSTIGRLLRLPLKLLPKTNCRECGEATCMVFAAMMADGIKGVDDCPPLDAEHRQKLGEYLSRFDLME